MKTLSIIIPSYNVENYISECLDSMAGVDDRLEIIIVNDGSSDRTEEIAKSYIERYPGQIRLISKENGGHGSTINVGALEATGKYIKPIDADDWIVTENLKDLMDRMDCIDADVIIAGYYKIFEDNGTVLSHMVPPEAANKEYKSADLPELFDLMKYCFEFHGIFYNRQFYCDNGITMSEKVFYEDQEYATLPFAFVKSIYVYDKPFYRYRCGNANQSVSDRNMVKRIGHLETVFLKLAEFYKKHPMDENQKEYYLRRCWIAANSLYEVSLIKNSDRKAGKKQAKHYQQLIDEKMPELTPRIEKRRKLLFLFNTIGIDSKTYQRIMEMRSGR